MSRYTVYNIAKDVTRKIHGGDIPDLQAALDEGRRNMIKNIQPTEMIRKAYMEQALYDQVHKYAIPYDMSYDNLIEIKLVSNYRNVDTLNHPLELVYRRRFDQYRKNARNVIAIEYENGVKYALINHPKGLKECQHLMVNDVNSLTANGSWNVGGNVINLRLDELNHITRNASLSFDINDSSSTGFIENFTMNPVDMSDYLNVGACFSWLSLPIPKEMVAVKITLGSNQTNLTTDFYTSTINQPHDNNEFVDGWNLLKYMLNDLSSVGNPNPKSIGFVRFDFTTTGKPIPSCNIDNIVIRKGVVYEMLYDSAFCVIDAISGAWKQFTTTNSDILPVEEDTYQILMLETAVSVQKELYGNNFGASTDVTGIQNELTAVYAAYKVNHTDESIQPTDDSYVFGDFMSGYSADSLSDGERNDYGEGNNYNDC